MGVLVLLQLADRCDAVSAQSGDGLVIDREGVRGPSFGWDTFGRALLSRPSALRSSRCESAAQEVHRRNRPLRHAGAVTLPSGRTTPAPLLPDMTERE